MNSTITVLGIFILLMGSVTMLILAFAKPKEKDDINIRLEKLKNQQPIIKGETNKKPDKLQTEINQLLRTVAPLAKRMLSPKAADTLNVKLLRAGKYETNPLNFTAYRIISAVVFPIIFLTLGYMAFDMGFQEIILAFIVLTVLGYFFPIVRLNRQIQDRHKSIFRALPDILDLLTICLEAGMGINEALNKVVEKSRISELRDEIERTLREIQLGNPRLQALRDMAKRIDLKELSSVVISIVQAEQMGTSLAKTLKIQSEIIRDIRWQKAQELAQKAPIKIIIPIAIFIFPTIFIIIFGPLVIGFITNNP